MRIVTIIVALVPLASGCAIFGIPNAPPSSKEFELRHHMIYIDGDGNLIDPATNETYTGSEQAWVDDILANFDKLADDAKEKEKPKPKLTIFVHGGLNGSDDVIERADKYTNAMLLDGQYPVFICWDSAMVPNYGEHLALIRRGKKRVALGILSVPFVLMEDASRAISRAPSALYKEYVNGPATMTQFPTDEKEGVADREKGLRDNHFVLRDSDAAGVAGGSWAWANYLTWANPAKILTAPIVDGLGSGSWDAMLRRADLVLSKRSAYEGSYQEGSEHEQYGYTTVTRLLVALEKRSQQPETILIGHSMGTIIANNILARHPRINFSHVVFMGAAARIKDVENVLVPWLRTHREAHFWSLSLDPYNEMSENSNFDFGPRGSLLNWIDFTFGAVNSFKDRTFGSWWNVIRTAEDVFPDVDEGKGKALSREAAQLRTVLVPPGKPTLRDRVHLTRFARGKDRGPQQHGEFDDYCFWSDRFWKAEGSSIVPYDKCVDAGSLQGRSASLFSSPQHVF